MIEHLLPEMLPADFERFMVSLLYVYRSPKDCMFQRKIGIEIRVIRRRPIIYGALVMEKVTERNVGLMML